VTQDCQLEWHPWLKDRVMGLNHQLAALSCAIAEAFFLNRTLLFPAALCLDARHEARWQTAGRKTSVSCGVEGASGYSVPTSSLLDLDAIGRLVRLKVVRLDLKHSTDAPGLSTVRAVEIDRTWRSERVAHELPCHRAPLVRRRISGFWFRPCAYGIVHCGALVSALDAAVGARGMVRAMQHSALVPHMLRSGLFYAAPIRSAAAAVRHALGGPYAAVHVRRSDRLSVGCGKECARADALTRPAALLARLRLWYSPGTRVFVGSTEPPAYFASLGEHFNLSFAEDYRPTLLRHIESNYALYAVETLVFFGAASMVETFGYSTSWLTHACFPSAALRSGRKQHDHTPRSHQRRGPASAVQISCLDAHGLRANGVYYGPACAANPPCGTEAMSLVPPASKTSSALVGARDGEKQQQHSGSAAAVPVGCGRVLELARTEIDNSCSLSPRSWLHEPMDKMKSSDIGESGSRYSLRKD